MTKKTKKVVTLDDGYHFAILRTKNKTGLFNLVVTEVKNGNVVTKWRGPDDGVISLCNRLPWITTKIYDIGTFIPEWAQCVEIK